MLVGVRCFVGGAGGSRGEDPVQPPFYSYEGTPSPVPFGPGREIPSGNKQGHFRLEKIRVEMFLSLKYPAFRESFAYYY